MVAKPIALQHSRPDLNEALKEGGRTGTTGVFRQRLRSALIVAEVALSLVLLMSAGLMMKSFLRLLALDLGFRPDNVLTMTINLPRSKYPKQEQWETFFRTVMERVKVLPGVTSVATTSKLPILGGSNGTIIIEGQPLPTSAWAGPLVESSLISPDYFQAMGIPLRKGRYFTERDDAKVSVAVVNETLARRFWPNQDPVGKRFSWDKDSPTWIEVVGVVGDVRQHGLEREPLPEAYHPFALGPRNSRILILRTGSDPKKLVSAIRREVLAVDRDQPVYSVRTMDEIFWQRAAGRRFQMALFGIFAGLAVVLATVGLYGVMSYAVSQRSHEIGIRMALGAQSGDALRLFLRQGMLLGLIGVGVGLALAFAVGRLLASLLYEVRPTDPATLAGVSLLLVGVALVASYIPARRATRIDPITALRYE